MYPTLTKRQKEILDYIKIYSELNGYAPSLVDIKQHFNLTAISTVHEHIENLKKKGYIHKEINQARSVRAINNKHGINDFTEIAVTGIIDGIGVNYTKTPGQTFLLHRTMLSKDVLYHALSVSTDALQNKGFFKQDLLVVQEPTTDNYQDTSYVVAEVDKKTLLMGRIVTENGSNLFMPLQEGNLAKLYKNFTVSGIIVKLIRDLN
ncbi:MAG: hypothetical protein QY330_03295 [Candidatus Dojkabacteria bacterium]|uniref:LexA repressor n=2 Tax=Candidatus Dojkabacteria TaxID=74243 RepID=A0A136KFR3_9BACT|nr:MAG: LexA repressor [candidate division WS6 bacterium OLB21]MBW7953341.1 hypothetical protein [Candidatus Dojkabacteria bacterium]WKZ27547.1 MAG: hypothetical protein QY330_03295 [Candidatus Dojkabacteria bacterium]